MPAARVFVMMNSRAQPAFRCASLQGGTAARGGMCTRACA